MSVEWSTRNGVEIAVYPHGVVPDVIDGEDTTTDGYTLGLFQDGEGVLIEGFDHREDVAAWLDTLAKEIRAGHYDGEYREAGDDD